MNITTLSEVVKSREPYKAHSGKFIVDIGNGAKGKYDYAAIIQDIGSFVVLIKNDKACIAFDGKRFLDKDFSYPLNFKKFQSSDEAYEKLMKWIGKMVKKDERARYYNDRAYKQYPSFDKEFDIDELSKISDIIKSKL